MGNFPKLWTDFKKAAAEWEDEVQKTATRLIEEKGIPERYALGEAVKIIEAKRSGKR